MKHMIGLLITIARHFLEFGIAVCVTAVVLVISSLVLHGFGQEPLVVVQQLPVPDDNADDTVTLQRLIDAGGIIDLEAGEYEFTRLTIRPGATIRGQGAQSTWLICTDNSPGDAFRREDDSVYVSRFRLVDLSVVTARSNVAAAQERFKDTRAINLAGVARASIQNVSITGFGRGAITFAQAAKGAEGLGFEHTMQDGNHCHVTNVYSSSCGKYGAGAFAFAYKANSNKLYHVVVKPGSVAFDIEHGNDNAIFGASVESSDSIVRFGPNAFSNAIYSSRGEVIHDDAYWFDAESKDNRVIGGHYTGVSGNLAELNGSANYVDAEAVRYDRIHRFPADSDVMKRHAQGFWNVTGLHGSPAWPLLVKSEEYNEPKSFPHLRLHSTVLVNTDNVLGRIGWWNADRSSGASGENAAIEAVSESAGGDTGLVFSTGKGGEVKPALRLNSRQEVELGSGARILSGRESPVDRIIAPKGTIYLRTTEGEPTFYVKTSSSMAEGWETK